MIENEPGFIMGPINTFLGYVLNIIFNIVYSMTEVNALGITIIVFTFIVRALMLPSGVKMQKNQLVMKKLQPEVDKINKKYGDSKDPEIKRKIAAETQALWASNGHNPMSGCIPLLVTMPIFFALYYLLRQPYMYVETINIIYERLAMEIMRSDNFVEVMKALIADKVPRNMTIDINLVSDMVKGISKMTSEEWATATASLTGNVDGVAAALTAKDNFESFLGLRLLDPCNSTRIGIIIPVLSALTQFASVFYGYKINPPMNAQQKQMQIMMMTVMPLFFGYITYTLTMGVGIYWISGNLFMLAQQVIITQYLRRKERKENREE
jgi:YidC/Oxa1 family membrane protein insertase